MAHSCPRCPAVFSTGEALRGHQRNHHPGLLDGIERVLTEAAERQQRGSGR